MALKQRENVSEAITFLYDNHRKFCVGHLPDAAQDDAYQEIMLAFVEWVRNPNFVLYENTKLSTCLYGLAHKVLIRLSTAQHEYNKHLAAFAQELSQVQVSQIEDADQKTVFNTFGALWPEEQALLIKYELRGEKRAEEIAKEMGISKATLLMRIGRIKDGFLNLCKNHGII